MHTIRASSGDEVSLYELVDQLHLICLSTRGRIRRLNRFLMGVDLIMSVAKDSQRAAIEDMLLQVAADCDLVESKGPGAGMPTCVALHAARMQSSKAG